ncbi:MAG: rhodanese-related sulfurtransferase [Bacteroidetes bacterium]|nr:rhodanese-related sulfurtransferase [Bacteroidota bacterium]
MSILYNRVNRDEMRKRVTEEPFHRITLSFYRYVILDDAQKMRNILWREWNELLVFGRIYLAREGINAQLSVPEHYFESFRHSLNQHPEFKDVPFKIAVEDDGKSFFRLTIKVRKKIVADGLEDDFFDVTNVGNHLSAIEFNQEMEKPGTIVVDMRNHYESEVGHFKNAILPQADTFKEELPMVVEQLKGKEEQKILMYCTGGIRCEKASAYLKHHGFKDVNQLYGGIIEYAREIKQDGIESKFIGKNFVFDERLGERITEDVIANCHQCGVPCDTHVNCRNLECNLLFIQCENCAEKMQGCCSEKCVEWKNLPELEKVKLRNEGKPFVAVSRYHSRLRPVLKDVTRDEGQGPSDM